jgi:hypothetical protein
MKLHYGDQIKDDEKGSRYGTHTSQKHQRTGQMGDKPRYRKGTDTEGYINVNWFQLAQNKLQ